jgi:hypothetical protein
MTDQPAEQPGTLAEALAQLQTDLPHIVKTTDAQYGKYADLAGITKQIMPKLGALGLSFTARPTLTERGFVLAYELRHISDDEGIGGEYPLPGMEKGPQALGSAITYARRYCLCAVTGVAPDADDDDAAAAEDGKAPARKPRGKTTMTAAQRAEHDALRDGAAKGHVNGTERTHGSTGDDMWAGQETGGPPLKPMPLATEPGTADEKQIRDISIQLNTLGITDHEAQLARIEAIINGPLDGPKTGDDGSHRTRKNLSRAEAATVRADLGEAIKAMKLAERRAAAAP